jgi:MarR family transcriptional regulator, organic hydroperoxide resistance regulator
MTVGAESGTQVAALEELRLAVGQLFGAERRLRGREQHSQLDVSLSQLRALHVLTQQEEVTAGQLAKSADLNPASVTAMLDQLEASGIVERRRAANDRRVCFVSLTDKGAQIVQERRSQWHALWEAQLGHLSERELSAALKVINAVTALIDDQ